MPPETDDPPGIPRWVKIGGIVLLVLVLLFLGARALGIGGQHGPGRHGGSPEAPAAPNGVHAAPTASHAENSPVAAGGTRSDVTADPARFEPAPSHRTRASGSRHGRHPGHPRRPPRRRNP